jgi:hypothetical protein
MKYIIKYNTLLIMIIYTHTYIYIYTHIYTDTYTHTSNYSIPAQFQKISGPLSESDSYVLVRNSANAFIYP